MSQQPLDLRTSLRIARRYKKLIGAVAALGLLAGVGYAVLNMPKATGEALIAIPDLTTSSVAQVNASGMVLNAGAQTQLLVAGSDPVLQAALPNIGSGMTLQKLRTAVTVSNPGGAIIAIDGHSTSGAQAVDIANAVAKSYVALVTSANSPVGRLNAHLLELAVNPTAGSPIAGLVPGALLGILAGALIGFIVALARGRNERRLRERDAIANAVGVPVLAAVPVMHPSDAADWAKLLDEYEPSAVHAWQLRKTLNYLGIPKVQNNGSGSGPISLAILTLSSDKRALALGPQLAAFAASLGIKTVLAVDKRQDSTAAATLYSACAVGLDAAPQRRNPLQTLTMGDGEAADFADSELVVLVIISDADAPRIPDTLHTNLTVLGVSASAATAEELSRIAMVADVDGRGVTGILVADPDESDRTSGRIPQLFRVQRKTPTRATGIPTESRR